MSKENSNKDSVYFQAHADNALLNERVKTLNDIREKHEYKKEFNWWHADYKKFNYYTNIKAGAFGIREARMSSQLDFIQSQLLKPWAKLGEDEYPKALKLFNKQYENTEQKLKVIKREFKNLLADAFELKVTDEKKLIHMLSNVDLDITKDLRKIKKFKIKSSEYVEKIVLKRERTTPPSREKLEKLMPHAVRKDISKTVGKVFDEALKENGNGQLKENKIVAFSVNDLYKLTTHYTKSILEDYDKRRARYKEGTTPTQIINIYFNELGYSTSKYATFIKDLKNIRHQEKNVCKDDSQSIEL